MRQKILFLQKELRSTFWCLCLWCCVCNFAVAQGQYYSWDFSDCELRDILYAVSLETKISIVADDTVSGKGNWKFAGKDFSAAFDSFLNSNRLFVEKGDVWIVSRFRLVKENGLLSIDAYDMQPNQILEKLSCGIESVLTFDSLPAQKITVHFKGISESALMDVLGKRFGNYSVSCSELGYHFAKKVETRKVDMVDGLVRIEMIGDGFFVDIREAFFRDVIEKLFSCGDLNGNIRNFCLLAGGDTKVQRSVFSGEDFTDTLAKICAQSGYSYVCDNNLFYIFANAGSKNELISGLREWKKYSLSFTKTQDFLQLLGKKVGKLETVSLPGDNVFLCNASTGEDTLIKELIQEIDVKQDMFPVYLKYIKPSDLLNHLPPSVDRANLFIADEDATLYFKGTLQAYENFKSQILLCDKPVKRLSYDLLILQYDESSQLNSSSNISASRMKLGDRNSAGAILGSVMNFNLNVVTAFGITFAADLQNSIEENKTKVFADTTLHGVSGKQINFQNTNTYRYRDNNVDPSTGQPVYSGVTREISSGIKLDVLGWVSGEGMITSKVTASVSRQGTDTSSSTGNPPPTSEKIVTTEVCGKSGEPVILSGLIQTADSKEEKRVPFISKIPIIGGLFKVKGTTKEASQMVIYLVPHIEGEVQKNIEKRFDQKWARERIESFKKKMEVNNVGI